MTDPIPPPMRPLLLAALVALSTAAAAQSPNGAVDAHAALVHAADGSAVTVTVRLSATDAAVGQAAGLGTSTFELAYDPGALSLEAAALGRFVGAQTDGAGQPVAYATENVVSEPSPGRVSVNVDLLTAGAGQPLPATPTDVATLTFAVAAGLDAEDFGLAWARVEAYTGPGGRAGRYDAGALTVEASGPPLVSVVVEGARGNRYFGPPAAGLTVDDLAAQNLVRGVPGFFPGQPATLWTAYDPVSGEWTPSEGTGEVLALGTAFRWYLLDRDGVGDPAISVSRSLPFTLSTARPANTASVVVTLRTDGNRFNYLANPFGVPLDLSGTGSWPGGPGIKSPLYVYHEPTASWEVPSGPIGPWEAFRFRAAPPRRNGNPRLLQIPASAAGLDAGPEAGGLASAEAAGAAAAGLEADAPAWAPPSARLDVRLAGASTDGRALEDGMLTLAFADDARAAFSPDEDVEKFQPPAEAYALLGVRAEGGFAGLDVRPFAPAEIALALEARGAAETFTLSWDASRLPDGLPVTLVDLETGAAVDLRTASTLTFRAASRPALDEAPAHDLARADDAVDRFVLRIGDALAPTPAEAVIAAAEAAGEPLVLALEAPAPNPSAASARVAFSVPEAGRVRLSVVDVRGREVAVLEDGTVEAGRYEAAFPSGTLAAGVYLVRLEAAGRVLVRQAAVVR